MFQSSYPPPICYFSFCQSKVFTLRSHQNETLQKKNTPLLFLNKSLLRSKKIFTSIYFTPTTQSEFVNLLLNCLFQLIFLLFSKRKLRTFQSCLILCINFDWYSFKCILRIFNRGMHRSANISIFK